MAETYTSGVWVVKDGEEEDFVAAWRDFVSWACTKPGSGTFRLVRDLDQAGRFMSFAPWDSLEAQEARKQDAEFAERLGRVRARTSEFTPSTYELVTTVE